MSGILPSGQHHINFRLWGIPWLWTPWGFPCSLAVGYRNPPGYLLPWRNVICHMSALSAKENKPPTCSELIVCELMLVNVASQEAALNAAGSGWPNDVRRYTEKGQTWSNFKYDPTSHLWPLLTLPCGTHRAAFPGSRHLQRFSHLINTSRLALG